MSRRRDVPKRQPAPDPRYQSVLVSSFINKVMLDGKKSTAESIVYGAFERIQEKTNGEPLTTFREAVQNVKPTLEVKSRRKGGANVQVPYEVRPERRTTLSLRWIVGYARKRPEKTMAEKLAGELLDASQNRGGAIKKREDTHKMAEANKAFAHHRW